MHDHARSAPPEPATEARPERSRPADGSARVLGLQRAIGNRAVSRMVLARRDVVGTLMEGARRAAMPPGADEFAKLLGSEAVARGQFVFSATIYKRVQDKLWTVIHRMPKDQHQWVWAQIQAWQTAGPKESAKILKSVKDYMGQVGTPEAAEVAALMGDTTATGMGVGADVYMKLWREYGKPGAAIPDTTKYETFSYVTAVQSYENIACKETTQRLGGKVAGGRSGKRSAGTVIPKDTSIAADIKRDKALTGGMMRGDVVEYAANLGSWVTKMRAALDEGWTIHARCISGTLGGEGGRGPDHSILIYGYAGDVFHFFDSDVGGTGGVTPGWGRVYYDSSVPRLSTAKTDDDFKVWEYSSQADWDAGEKAGRHRGYQASGAHRYQVKDIWTM